MIPQAFDYKRAGSVAEALDLLDSGDAKILAGGHSLIPAMKLRLNSPGTLIDIAKISALQGIRQEGDELVIGAAATHYQIASSELVKNTLSMLAEGAAVIGDPQVRNKGTIGGSLAHADPAADWPALLMAADAGIVCQSKSGSRTVSATDFSTGLFATALEDGEIITEIRIPMPPAGTKSSYQKFVQPASRFSIAGCAAVRYPDGSIKVAFSGVADAAFRDTGIEAALNGQALTADNIAAAVAQAAAGKDILSDHFAAEDYRLHLAKVYAKRALMAVA